MNRRVLSGVLVLGGTLATVGAAVSASSSSVASEAANQAVISSSPLEGSENSAALGEAEAQVPVRDGRLTDDVIGEERPSPVSVRIGDIGLEASILSVGVDETNQLDVPSADKVGWYEYSALPGQAGATVLAAHVDYGGTPGAFFNLGDLARGDRIDVEMSDGSVIVYRVTATQQFQKTELPAEEVFRKTGDTVLQLITCGGEFDPSARSYLSNVVVTAEPEGPQSV